MPSYALIPKEDTRMALKSWEVAKRIIDFVEETDPAGLVKLYEAAYPSDPITFNPETNEFDPI